MRRREVLSSVVALAAAAAIPSLARAQELVGDESAPLFLTRIIPIPDTVGRFDHMAVDNKRGLVFATVFGNDTVEVLQLERAKRIRTLAGAFNRPQAALYMPDLNRLAISNSEDGTVKIFDGDSFNPIGTVKFDDDADNMRYDPVSKRVYVGYGEGAIGVFDATTNKRLGDYELGVHPESFQLEQKGPRIFVNLASTNEIAVIDRITRKIARWPLKEAGTNFPMALDEEHRRLFVAARRPARLLVLDMDSGKVVASLAGASDTDDMWYDSTRKRIYVPSGEGFMYCYQQIDADHYERQAKIPTAIGARTSSYSGQVGKHNSLYLAVPARVFKGAELWIYETRD
jgi:DNA-binding beta-propeller fold protein YncE